MKEYLQLFRGQAFNGSLELLKRVLLPNVLISVLIALLSIVTISPLILKGLGMSFTEMMAFNERIGEMIQSISKGQDPMEVFGQYFGVINLGYLAAAGIVAILFAAYRYVVFFQLNDDEVRKGNRNMLDALRLAFNEKIFTMIGLYIIMILIMSAVFLGYCIVVVLLMKVSGILGGLMAFILFFVMAVFIIRVMIAPAAMVHGNMGIMDSINFSFKNITWKRAGILFLMGLVFMIALFIVSLIVGLLTKLTLGQANSSMAYAIISQLISAIFNAILGVFIYTSLTAIYFRYSNDGSGDDDNYKDNLVT